MTSPSSPEAYVYLRAASAGLRHHARGLAHTAGPADRVHLDLIHAHLTALHQLLDRLAEQTRPPHPAAGRHLAGAHLRLWQATAEVHDAFHKLPSATSDTTLCRPERLPEGPPVLTICQRHLACGHTIRRKSTPTDLNTPPHHPARTNGCAI
ncbi:DUF6238 family protein [Streptomyces sp. NPDC059928]|uniref:DUF6238 family protein n=1 Tax=unclassified Streptomyces TaxID=2593676 RepID=UPI00365594AC